jgi:glycosyltransferase involved in cell wall biosynthesis
MSKRDARQALGLDPNVPTVLSVARLAPEKGLAILAAAANEISASVFIAGDGPERHSLSAYKLLKLVGHVNDPWQWYCAADVIAVPSLTEGLGLSAIEALSTGCPVVASDVGGLPEVVSEACLGTLVPPANPAALATAINAWLAQGRGTPEDEAIRREYASRKFSVDAMLSATSSLYRRILGT